MDASGLALSSPGEVPEGQVCNRCRQKKIKCDGATPSCSNCASAGVTCEVSAKLRRKTKIRGYAATNTSQASVDRLTAENGQLRRDLQVETERVRALKRELDRANEQLAMSGRSSKARKITEQSGLGAQSPLVSLSGESDVSSFHRSAFVIKHMGRMVFDQTNLGRFAGSTTGVHFVASVEELCRRLSPAIRAFPEDCFRLHLVQSRFASLETIDGDYPEAIPRDHICALLDQSLDFYLKQLDTFNESWLAFCPIVPRRKFARDLGEALSVLRTGAPLTGNAPSSIQAITVILLINKLFSSESQDNQDVQRYIALSCQLHHQVVARADLESLQALILFSLYLQLGGQTSWLIQVNGIQVRLAQSLGMHRHARRFRFTESEIELRKRMWWWVYSFDKLTSLVHGLPKLISDSDVDNDLPIDCELHDTDTDGLTHPLPGEPTAVALFIQYIHMCKLLSAILGQLYTTSQRRGGEEKISRLDRDLRVWHQNFSNTLQIPSADVSDVDKMLTKIRWRHFGEDECSMIAWLDLMANFAVVLIHRPALTFDNATQRFRESLNTCLKSCSAMIQVASSSALHKRSLSTVPFGPAVVFQSALMHVFYRCNTSSAGTPERDEESVVARGMHLLDSMDRDTSATLRKVSMSDVVPLLQTLSDTFFGSTTRETFNATSQNHSSGGPSHFDGSIIMPHSGADDTFGTDFWHSTALDSLNHLDAFPGNWEGTMLFDPRDT